MKKISIVALMLLLGTSLILGYGAQPVLAEQKGKYGGIAKMNFRNSAGRFGNPLNIRHSDRLYAGWGGLEQLVVFSEKNIGQLVPQLASSWELAPDRSSYTFHLRKGIKFSDGTDFNAQAVKWNLEKVRLSKRPYFKNVTSIDIIDDHTIRFNLSQWNAMFLYQLEEMVGFIISPTAFEKHGEKWADTHPVGTGPFKLKDFKRNIHFKTEKNDNYWEKGKPYLDGVEIYNIAEEVTAMAALLKGELHALKMMKAVTGNELKGKGVEFKVNVGGQMGLYFNSTNPKSVWSDRRMREALEYAVNKEDIAKELGLGFVEPRYICLFGMDPREAGTSPRKYNP